MSRFLVTGGAGFIGSHLVDRLVEQGHQVTVLDNLSTGKRENLAHHAGSIELIEGDVADRETVERAVFEADYVLHQAARPSVARSVHDPLATDRTNVGGTLNLLNACRDAGVKRVVMASSSSIYGDTPILPKSETMRTAPRSPYAASKAAAEAYGIAYYHTYGLEVVALRYFNVFGPRQDPTSQYSAVIPRFITAALDGSRATVFGDGTQSRDFCYVENVVEANLLACHAANVAGRVFNIACGERVTLLEVLELLGGLCGGTKVAYELAPKRAGDVEHSLADIECARRDLGYVPRLMFKAGLARTVAWYRDRRGVGPR